MRRVIFTICAIIAILAAGSESYAEITVSASVNSNIITIEDVASLSVSISGVRSTAIPQISGGDGFTVSYSGSSSNYTFINGKSASSVDFKYVLKPKKMGKFSLPDIVYEYKGKSYKVKEKIEISVIKAPENKRGNEVYTVAEVSNSSPYVSEQIIFKFKLYTKVQFANPSFDNPDFSRFYSEELRGTKGYQELVDGYIYAVNEVSYALFPLKAGEYTIPSIALRLDVITRGKGSHRRRRIPSSRMFNEYKTKRINTDEVKLTVKPLPPYTNKDVPFSNLVGQYGFTAILGKDKLKVNDSTTLTITLTGPGNIKDAVMPPSGSSDKFKTYDDKPIEQTSLTRGGVYGSKTFKRAFIPLTAGQVSIPSIKFSYFDPAKDDYVILSTKEYNLTVEPSSEAEELNLVEMAGSTTTKAAVKIIGQDVLPINSSLDTIKNVDTNINPVIGVFAILLPGFVYFAFVAYKRRQEMHETDESILRRKRALKKYSRAAGSLLKTLKDDNDKFYGLLLNSFKDYIGDKFNIVGIAMTVSEVSDILSKRGVSAELIANIRAAVEKLERAQFASEKCSTDEKRAILKTLSSAVKKIEKKS